MKPKSSSATGSLQEMPLKFATKTIHAGMEPDPSTGAIIPPIYQTSTYVQVVPGEHKGYAYGRPHNPTRDALQKALASLENGKYAVCFSSGMAAIDAILKWLKPGDEVLATSDIYGGSYRIFMNVFSQFDIKFTFVDMSNAENISRYLSDRVKMIFIETPTNPLLQIIDIKTICTLAKVHNILTVVDNTFASPYLQNPLDLGADVVLHSITKYIGGHSDVIMGCVVVNDEKLRDHLLFIQNACGAIPGPQDCFLSLRGMKTLYVRMKAHCENGTKVAHFLYHHPKVAKVFWPGFPTHPNHHIAKVQMKDFGAMLSFSLVDDSIESAFRFMRYTRIFALAESLGGVESLIGHPVSMTHASIPEEERRKLGIVDSLIRLSVGIEDGDDLISDLAQALEKV